MDTSPHKSDFVSVNGIKLHYLDWGGKGDALIFLTGMGCSAHLFDHIAPRFTDSFRVLALTRRGQGESDYPEAGYDLDTLVDDILDFMDLMNVDKAILAGHSLAGVELTYFTEKYPSRVLKLIYLDAVYDRKARMEIFKNHPLNKFPPPELQTTYSSLEEYVAHIKYTRPDLAKIWNEIWDDVMIFDLTKTLHGNYVEKDTASIGKQMIDGATKYNPQHANIRIPVLSFVAITDVVSPPYLAEEQKQAVKIFHRNEWLPFRQKEIAQFKEDIPYAKVIEIQNSNHYCFMSDEELVYEEMRKFLLE